MRSTLATGATLVALAALPAGAALARPAPPDPPVAHETPAANVAAAPDTGGDHGGMATGWALVLGGGAALAGGAVGFAGGRTHRVQAPLPH
jgi:hypothetical protein